MIVKFSFSTLKDGRWYEYVIRFALGGMATVFTGVISSQFGASIGGLFLALPAIFCASATLIEKHEERRKRDAGLDGRRRGQQAAALDAAGAALGSIGLSGFGLFFSALVERHTPTAFIAALAGWCVISAAAWWSWRYVRHLTWGAGSPPSHPREHDARSMSAREQGSGTEGQTTPNGLPQDRIPPPVTCNGCFR